MILLLRIRKYAKDGCEGFFVRDVLLRIRRAETRIFHYGCTDTHTNLSVCEAICAQIGGCLLRTNSLANSYADAKTWLNFMLKVAK